MQNHHKPPRPPPLSVSSTNPPPPPQPMPKPEPKPKPDSKPINEESPESPLRSNDHENSKNSTAIVAVTAEKYYSPLTSPAPITPPHQIINFNRREEPPATSGVVGGGDGEDGEGGGGGERKSKVGKGEKRGVINFGGVKNIVRKSKKEELIEKLNLGIRVYQIVFCLISFSVMAADRTQGWSGDSFDRYKEYRFCFSVTILGFLYSAFQAYDVGSHLVTGKHVISHHLRYQFDFIMDQILAYLLISASSASASRIDDWQANWGKDEFTEKASASVSMAFMAFLGYAMSSLITGYNLCNRDLS